MPKKEPVVVEYDEAPEKNYQHSWITVGRINRDAETNKVPGPQRDLPSTNAGWKRALETRYKAYGAFNPLLVTDRVISRREDGSLWPLDGNGSNHWYEKKFGPDYKVPCRVITGLTLVQELRVFLALNENRKAVSRQNKHVAEAKFDTDSVSARLEKIVEECGFHVSNSTTDALGIADSPGAWVLETLGEARLRETLHAIKVLWPESMRARANGSIVKGLASALNKPQELDQDILFTLLKATDPKLLAQEARGKASERIVLARIEELYKLETGQVTVEELVPAQPQLPDEPEDGASGDEAAPAITASEPIAFVPVPVFSGAATASRETAGNSVPDPEAIAAQEAQAGSQAPPEAAEAESAPRNDEDAVSSTGTAARRPRKASTGAAPRGRRGSRSPA